MSYMQQQFSDNSDKLLWIFERIVSYFGQGEVIKDIRDRRKNKKINQLYFTEINHFYQKKLEENLIYVQSEEAFNRQEAYEFWIDKQTFNAITQEKKNMLVLLALCSYYSNSKDVNTYAAIKSYVDTINISFSGMNEETKNLLNAYSNLFKDDKKYKINSLFFETKTIEYKSLLKEFVDKFSNDLALRFIGEELAQSEELRDTLIRLIKDGRLATYGVNNATLETLEKELKAKANYAKTFVLLTNKLPDTIAEYLAKQPRIGAIGASTRIPEHNKGHKFGVYIIRPSEGFRTSKELLKKFKSLTKGYVNETTIQIMPIDGINMLHYTFPVNQSFTNVNLRNAYEISSYFKAGMGYTDADIWNIIEKSEVGINNLLALIPFNILVPGIYPSEKDFIIKNYPELQKKMDITTLTDWAEKDPILLKNILSEIGSISYTDAEKAVIGDKDRIRFISESIVNNSKKLKASLSNLVATNDMSPK